MLLVAVAATLPVTLGHRAAQLAAEVGARRDVLCARYASLGGLALGVVGEQTATFGEPVRRLQVTRVRLSPSWCVLRASATCGRALRTLERTVDPHACD